MIPVFFPENTAQGNKIKPARRRSKFPIPGYYGTRGFELMIQTIMARFVDDINAKEGDDPLIGSRLCESFVN